MLGILRSEDLKEDDMEYSHWAQKICYFLICFCKGQLRRYTQPHHHMHGPSHAPFWKPRTHLYSGINPGLAGGMAGGVKVGWTQDPAFPEDL